MGIDYIIISDLNVQSFKLNHDAPHRFVQPSIGRSISMWYVLYRWFAAAYFSASLAVSITFYWFKTKDLRYLLHFPVWGYSIMTLYSILLAIHVNFSYRQMLKAAQVAPTTAQQRKTTAAAYKRRHKKKKKKSNQELEETEVRPSLSLILKVIWVMHYISLYSGVMTIVMYFFKLFKGVVRGSWPNPPFFTTEEVIIHMVFGPLTFLDFWMSGIPIRFLHLYVMPCYSFVYHVTILTYTIVMTALKKYPPFYEAADYYNTSLGRIMTSILYFIGFAFITPVAIHFIYYMLYIVKMYVSEQVMFRIQRLVDSRRPSVVAAKEAVQSQTAADAAAAAAAAATAAAAPPAAEDKQVFGAQLSIPPTISEMDEDQDIIVDQKVFTNLEVT